MDKIKVCACLLNVQCWLYPVYFLLASSRLLARSLG